MIVFDAIFPVITATMVGLAGVEREIVWSARNMGASNRDLLWQVLLPAALPQILTGLQVALPLALIVAVVTEMAMGGYGLGGAMIQASRFADFAGRFCRHRGNCIDRLWSRRGDDAAAAAPAAMARRGRGGEHARPLRAVMRICADIKLQH